MIIELDRIKQAVPKKTNITRGMNMRGKYYIEFLVPTPGIEDEELFVLCKRWLRDIIGSENIMEFYTHEEGRHWTIYLNALPHEYVRYI
jgi:hypothetical protein